VGPEGLGLSLNDTHASTARTIDPQAGSFHGEATSAVGAPTERPAGCFPLARRFLAERRQSCPRRTTFQRFPSFSRPTDTPTSGMSGSGS